MKKIIAILLWAFLTLGIITVLLFFNFKYEWGKNESMTTGLNLVTVVTAVMGAIGIVLQLSRDKSLKEVQFIVDFNKNFVEFDDLMKVHDMCSERFGMPVDEDYKDKPLDHTAVYKYLDAFEPLYFLLKNKAVSVDKMYDLVSYRFFIVVCTPEVQREIILKHEDSYENIISMYRILEKYRIKKGKKPPFRKYEENDLLKFLENNHFSNETVHATQETVLKSNKPAQPSRKSKERK